MAASNKNIKQKENPKGNNIGQGGDPDQYYSRKPSWRFFSCDRESWCLSIDSCGDEFWSEILPYLKSVETRTWGDIFAAKKQNHSINIGELNRAAVKRLLQMNVELEAVVSLTLAGTHRLYGYIVGSAFNILWVDFNHGDNETCVCRSHKKHT